MTREKAINVITNADLSKVEDRVIKAIFYLCTNKALEQEPILDKIRAEIEQERVGYPPSADYYKAIMKCLQIIDKYKAEKER